MNMDKKIQKLLQLTRGALAENEVKELLSSFGISTTTFYVVQSKEDVQKLDLDFPVALKVCSHLGLVLDETCINEKVIHGVLSRHAKTPQLKYGSKQRQSEMNKISKKLRMEIKRGLKWAEMQAEFPIGRSLPNALVS